MPIDDVRRCERCGHEYSPRRFDQMVLAQAGEVTLHPKTYPLDSAVEALDALDNGRVSGTAILVS